MNILILILYRLLVIPVVIILPFAAFFKRKVREGLRLRKIHAEPLPSGQNPIWIHAASGEFEYAKAVIRRMKERFPDIPIVVTYFSPTFAKVVQHFPGVDRAVALPLDLPGPCASFLKNMHPRLLLIARTDLWPEMLEQCRTRNIPVVLFSYTQKAIRQPFKKLFTRWMFHWAQRIYCVSAADRDNLNVIPLRARLEVMGDTRYDQVAYRLSHGKPIAQGLHPKGGAPCLTAGSTWPEDESVLLQSVAGLLLSKSLKLILVPHEPTPEHLASLENQLRGLGLTYAFFSNGFWDSEHVLVVDQVGVLAELYALGTFAFIGGSFRKSVHSVMEALGAGCLTFVGPFHENNREALEFKAIPFNIARGVEVVETHEQWRDKLADYIARPQEVKIYSAQLGAEFKKRLGASDRLIDSLQDLW